ncbi:RagB/SusD family nutrient uptake outer membrane protein [Carboxylicivirga mesophila]|uniref:RagB/SusD family nutrient uptake outer membrane protein n=1 Tax=Carboxylicivirga mesophila TaxID=1166478 RepID=A0ABS5KHX3_9BACT|nr:RagB/SusD family nutrient uptake outer membrane protein [Carboxylicivirga mesophila]MBS2213961.1 RagB/SusD family nutrient uptake outer membrane protein [Carboxylicivirga mesophila]
MKKIIYLFSLLISLSLVSCESFFDLKPHDSTPTSDILTNVKDAQTMLNGVYARFMSSSSYGKNLTVLTDIMTDASLAASGFTNQMGYMYAWNIQPGVSEVSGLWSNHYGGIYNCNFLINNIDNLEGDSDEINRIKGEALIGRALLHYNMVRHYGKTYKASSATQDLGVPYITVNEIGAPHRNTVQDVYHNIIEDLEQALDLLPANPSADNVTFTSHFANGLLARVYLDMKDYDNAIIYASEVIDNSGCILAEGEAFQNMWLRDFSDEIIWKVGYTETDLGSAPGYNFGNRNNTSTLPQPDYIPADWLLNLYDVNNDIRFTTYFTYGDTGHGWPSYMVNKYPTNPTFPFTQGMNMPKPMRLAEMYLIKAEAHAMQDEGQEARDALDVLLTARIANHNGIGAVGDQLKQFIFEERIRELIFEGFYYHDLKRFGLGFERSPQENTSAANDLKILGDDYRWQWPIPTSEINGNPNIKEQQNPGY